MRYGYRVVGYDWVTNLPTGLVGLASTKAKAEALSHTTRATTRILRERWTPETWDAVAKLERQGRIPRDLSLALAAKLDRDA